MYCIRLVPWIHPVCGSAGILCLLLVSNALSQGYDENKRVCAQRRHHPICCPGWYNGINSPCSIPACAGNCGDHGRCVKPHTCLCPGGRLRFSCDATDRDEMQQDQQVNGHCPSNCNGRGRCLHGRCNCDDGYAGSDCQNTLEAPCYVILSRGLCVSAISKYTAAARNETINVTREVCCNALGMAWGSPCELCKPTTYCGRGYQLLHGRCVDINECNIPGVCQGGQCINQEGHYICNCPLGYTYKQDVLQCVPEKSACERGNHLCSPGGRCVPLWNSGYKCNCRWGYVPSDDQKSCTPGRVVDFNICELYKSSICKNGECISRQNSYECRCNQDYYLSEDRKTCQRMIDYCSLHRGQLCKNGNCVSQGQDYYCQCNHGFVQSFDRRSCLSRCEHLGSSICLNGYCVSFPNGDYECQCRVGYEATPDRKLCLPGHVNPYGSATERYGVSYIDRQKAASTQDPTDRFGWRQQHEIQRDVASPIIHRISRTRGSTAYTNTRSGMASSPYGAPCNRPEVLQACGGGFCLNLGGQAYQCECTALYNPTSDGRRCIRSTNIRGANQKVTRRSREASQEVSASR